MLDMISGASQCITIQWDTSVWLTRRHGHICRKYYGPDKHFPRCEIAWHYHGFIDRWIHGTHLLYIRPSNSRAYSARHTHIASISHNYIFLMQLHKIIHTVNLRGVHIREVYGPFHLMYTPLFFWGDHVLRQKFLNFWGGCLCWHFDLFS